MTPISKRSSHRDGWMIPKIFHITLPKNGLADNLVEAIRNLHQDWEIKVWRDPLVSDEFLLGKYFSKCNSGAQLADLIRIDVLYRFGGVYIDSDVDILRCFDPLVENYSFFIASEDGKLLTNAIFGSAKEHPAMSALIERLLDREPDWTKACNTTTGPEFYTRILGDRNDITVLPRSTFYPYNWDEAEQAAHRFSYAVHRWAGSWVTKKEVKTAQKRSHNPKEYLRRAMRSAVRFATEGGRVGLSGDSSGQRNSRFYSCSPEIVLETKRGIKMVASGSDLSVTPELAFNGVYEPAEESFVAKMLKGGDTFIDVGANVGVFTLLAAQKVFRFGRVVAFEPNPCVTRLLRKSLVLNWWQGRVDIQECAVADFKGVKTLYFSGDNLGGARLDTDEVSPVVDEVDRLLSVTQKLDANVVRLDDVFPVDLPLRILKIDVEGHEATVLRGASRLLSRKCVDFIILEMIADIASKKQWQDTASEIQKLISLGYSLHKLSSEGDLMPLENYELDLENNRTRSVVLSAGLIQT